MRRRPEIMQLLGHFEYSQYGSCFGFSHFKKPPFENVYIITFDASPQGSIEFGRHVKFWRKKEETAEIRLNFIQDCGF